MAFDWTVVDGYREDMTAEEKVQLLAGFELPKPAPDADSKLKSAFDKTSSELASAKKKIKEFEARMSEEEKRELERQAAEEERVQREREMQEELDRLHKNEAVSNNKITLLSMGYNDSIADELANALYSGDNKAIFEAMKKHGAAREQALKEEILRGTPTPPGGKSDDAKSDAVRLAESLGSEASAANKAADDIVNMYV